MRPLVLPAVLLSLLALTARGADDAGKTKLAEKLVNTMRVENLLRNGSQLPVPVDVVASADPNAATAKGAWQKLKQDYVKAYADVYTEGELRALITFYQSPIGQLYLDKTPELSRRLSAAHQKLPVEPTRSK